MNSEYARPTTRPRLSKTRTVEPVVPWSTATTTRMLPPRLSEEERAPAPEPLEDEGLEALARLLAQAADRCDIVGVAGRMARRHVDRLAGEQQPLRREWNEPGEPEPRERRRDRQRRKPEETAGEIEAGEQRMDLLSADD